jgi:Putative transmembrane protein (PGPGW)
LAGTVGFEPTILGPEPSALPLGHVPLARIIIRIVLVNSKVYYWEVKRVKSAAKKIAVSIIGFSVVIIGIILLPLPGPGILIIIAGLAILSTEFEKADKILTKVRARFEEVTKKTRSLIDKDKK